MIKLAALASCLALAGAGASATQPALLLVGTVVTMDDAHTVVPDGHVLVRNGLIVAVWSGATPPAGVNLRNAHTVHGTYIFSGLINLQDHPSYDVLPLWMPPSSHAEPSAGRPTGREPYDNRYQWNAAPPPEFTRLVVEAHSKLNPRDVLVHAEVRAALASPLYAPALAQRMANGEVDGLARAPRRGCAGRRPRARRSILVATRAG